MNKAIHSFLNQMNACVRYCHWKSNLTLGGGQSGATDFDLLIHKNDRLIFEKIAFKYGFQKTSTVKERQIKGTEDWIYFLFICKIGYTPTHSLRIMDWSKKQQKFLCSF